MEKVSLKKIHEFGSMISKDSPYFIKAQEICLDILMQSNVNKSSHEEKTVRSLDDEESEDDFTHINLLKLKFKHALNSDPDLARLLYKQLCGLPMDDKRNLKKVHGDYDTLIEIADILRETNQELRVLKQKDKKLSASSAFFPSANVNVDIDKLKASESENNESLKKEKITNSPHFRRSGT